MSQPRVYTWRMLFQWTIDGLTHHTVLPVKIGNASATPPTITYRDSTTQDWTLGADAVASVLSEMLAAGTTYPNMLLQQLVGLNWNLVDAHTPAATNEAGTFHAAGQVTFVLRDTANYKLKSILVDGNFSGLSHYGSRTGLAGGFLDWVKAFSHDHVGPDDPYMWLVSLGERYIRDTDANFAGFTVATNRKIRRRRGLA